MENKRRDDFKKSQCEIEEITLIRVWKSREIIGLRYKLKKLFPENKRLDLYLRHNDYMELINYEPKRTWQGSVIEKQVKIEIGKYAQNQETESLRNRKRR